jgi:ABC-2 type transport system permease protein
MNPAQIWLVTKQEFRIRLRTGRWRWLILAWALLLFVFTALLDAGLATGYGITRDDSHRGVPLFGFLMYFILGMMLVISPALTSQTINGDRERGTLATLQVTRLQPLEIALGKLLAGWGVGLVALAVSVPFTGYAMAQGGITVVRVVALYAVVAVLIGVVCAVSQALSALLARSITSALLSYLTVAALTIGTLIAYALALPLMREDVPFVTPDGSRYNQVVVHQERVWWLLAANPFVVLADSAPRVPPQVTVTGDEIRVDNYDPLSAIGNGVRGLRRPMEPYYSRNSYEQCSEMERARQDLPVWPYGLGFNLLLGVAAVTITTYRLRTPSRKLARGVRVA